MVQTNNDNIRDSFALRRSLEPYVGLVVIFLVLTAYGLYYTFSSHDWFGLSALYGWIFVAFIVWVGMRYRIFWDNGAIIQKAVAGNVTKITTNDITRVQEEKSSMQTLLTFSRPMRRIVIYADGEKPKHIDVSLKHFVADDIRRLMKAIHAHRPDLVMPQGWI
jgi:hypothetical protein